MTANDPQLRVDSIDPYLPTCEYCAGQLGKAMVGQRLRMWAATNFEDDEPVFGGGS